MAGAFRELWKWSGVDELSAGAAAMIVPSGGSNFVQLENGNGLVLRVKSDGKKNHANSIRIDDISDGSKQGEIGKRKKAHLALRPEFNVTAGRRTFEIVGKHPAGIQGVAVEAYNPGTKSVDAKLRVVVLRAKPVKVSLRMLYVMDGAGKPVPHSDRKFEPDRLLEYLNLILTPQTNIEVTLGLTTPANLFDGARIAKALDLKAAKASVPDVVSFDRFKDLLAEQRDNDADCTIFFMRKVGSGLNQNGSVNKIVNGRMDSNLKIGMIADEADKFFYARTLAHELGHFLGRSVKSDKTYQGFPDLSSDADKLMQQGGSGLKVTVEHCVNHFNKSY